MKRNYYSDPFQSTRNDQNSSKFYETLRFQIEAFGLENRTREIFFFRVTQYRARLKGPSFSFFGIVRLFLGKKFSQRVPLQFFDVLRQNRWMSKNPKGSVSVFSRHFQTSPKFLMTSKGTLHFFATEMLKNSRGPSFSAPGARASGLRRAD